MPATNDNNQVSSFSKETYPAIAIPNSIIDSITDPALLGILVYVRFIAIDQNITAKDVAEHFNIPEHEAVDYLHRLMFLGMIKRSES